MTDPRERARHAWDGWTDEDVAAELAPWPKETTMEQKPSIGRIVHFHDDDGTHVAAIVAVASDPWIVDLRTISFDPANDRGHSAIRYDMDGSNGTWRWPSRVP